MTVDDNVPNDDEFLAKMSNQMSNLSLFDDILVPLHGVEFEDEVVAETGRPLSSLNTELFGNVPNEDEVVVPLRLASSSDSISTAFFTPCNGTAVRNAFASNSPTAHTSVEEMVSPMTTNNNLPDPPAQVAAFASYDAPTTPVGRRTPRFGDDLPLFPTPLPDDLPRFPTPPHLRQVTGPVGQRTPRFGDDLPRFPTPPHLRRVTGDTDKGVENGGDKNAEKDDDKESENSKEGANVKSSRRRTRSMVKEAMAYQQKMEESGHGMRSDGKLHSNCFLISRNVDPMTDDEAEQA